MRIDAHRRVELGLPRARRGARNAFILASALALGSLLGPGGQPTPAVASSGFDTHQGIDRCGDQPHQKVQDLWVGTPFYNYGLYIGGAEGTLVGCISTVAFTNFVRSVGFGITPIWDDLQPPCTANSKKISTNTTTARNQGVTAGHNAQTAASNFGFGAFDNIWLDIENFDESNAGCKASVHAYIDGWDSVLNPELDAGVYINHANADSLRLLANPPDAIWIAKWNAQLNSVWGFADIPNTHWTNDQRMHQYRGSKTYNLPFGCSGAACTDGTITVDVDCADAWVGGGTLTADNDANEPNEADSPTAEATCNGPSQ